jgi:hypothetical protein
MPASTPTHDHARPCRVPDDRQELGLAVLIVEATSNAYEPVAVVSTLREAAELSQRDLDARCAAIAAGKDTLCPSWYIVWARDHNGAYRRLHAFDAEELLPGGRYDARR